MVAGRREGKKEEEKGREEKVARKILRETDIASSEIKSVGEVSTWFPRSTMLGMWSARHLLEVEHKKKVPKEKWNF